MHACACVTHVHMYIHIWVHGVHAYRHLYIHNSPSRWLSLARSLSRVHARTHSHSLSTSLSHPTLFLSPILKPREKASKANKSILGQTSILLLFLRSLSLKKGVYAATTWELIQAFLSADRNPFFFADFEAVDAASLEEAVADLDPVVQVHPRAST